MSFNFGTPKTVTGFTLPTVSTATVSTAGGGAGDSKTQIKPLTNLFGTPTTTTAFSLGTAIHRTTAPTLNFGLSTTATSSTSAPSLNFSTTPASSTNALQFTLGGTATTTAASFTTLFGSGSSLPAASSAASTTGSLKLTTGLTPSTTAATTSAPLSLTTTSAATQATTTNTTTTTTTSVAVTSATTSTSTLPIAGALTYTQLEDSINKWTVDLEEQVKFFINQARELNAWDNLLVSNSDKISALNQTIEQVKQQQKELDQELDFILAQQNELDELSAPLEKQLSDMPVTDQNRFQMYQLSEIIDSQMKQMSEDLKEIVEHLNESNKNEDISDPVVQLARILSAHMNSLTWIDSNTAQISAHLEQIQKMHEIYKQNHLNF